MSNQIITPYEVKTDENGVDYNKLIQEFGTTPISSEIITKIQQITNQPVHPLLRRGTYFSHRSLDQLLTDIESNKPFYVYTGRGPSAESMHIGHLLQFEFTKYLQDAFNVQVVIQLTDDEKFYYKDLTLEQATKLAYENMKDIIACGFNPEKTFIFVDSNYMGYLYHNIVKINKCLTQNQIKNTMGLQDNDNLGKYSYPPIQIAPAFSTSFPHLFPSKENVRCLVPCGVDQDPFFRIARDVAHRLKYHKPAVIHSKFLPGLKGVNSKMSSSDPTTCILLTDTPAQIKNKINRKAFSGGKVDLDEHRKYGGDVTVDVAYHYLTFFLDDDQELESIKEKYTRGEMLTSELKKIAIDLITKKVLNYQERRKNLTDDIINQFIKI